MNFVSLQFFGRENETFNCLQQQVRKRTTCERPCDRVSVTTPEHTHVRFDAIRQVAEISISLSKFDVTEIKFKKMISRYSTFAKICGIMSWWVGLSFMFGFELLNLILKLFLRNAVKLGSILSSKVHNSHANTSSEPYP